VADRREDLRAADVDRQFVAERLKAALDEGRLSLGEYDDRLKEAYAARTYGDLDVILKDLPGFHPVGTSQLAPHEPEMDDLDERRRRDRDRDRSNPRWLIGIWSAWIVAVSVNVVIWALVSISSGEAVYFWPMWVAGPWGAVLLATTFSTRALGNHPDDRQRRYRDS
jgi:cobalamin biosynthesis protein CobD/CbiB